MTILRTIRRVSRQELEGLMVSHNAIVTQVYDLSQTIPGGSTTFPNRPRVANLDGSDLTATIAICNSYIQNLDRPYDDKYWYGSKTDQFSNPHPLDQISLHGFRNSVKTPDFEKRCREGEIIVNDYDVVKCVISTQIVGELRRRLGRGGGRPYLDPSNPYLTVTQALCQGRVETGVRIGNLLYVCAVWPSVYIYDEEYILPEVTSFLGASWSPQKIYESILKKQQENPVSLRQIQSALADANSKDLDALTAIAEMPETIQSMIDGVKLITKIVKDARKREFKIISRQGTLEKEYAQKAYAVFRARKEREILKGFTSKKFLRRNPGSTMDDYHKEVQRRLKRIESFDSYSSRRAARFRRDAAIEIADELSSLQLNVQYNIKPTVYLIQDLEQAIRGYSDRAYASTRKREVINVDVPINDDVTVPLNINQRVFIKRQYNMETSAGRLNALLMTDVVVTAFEKIRLWSIIGDWVFTISDFLKSISWNPQHIQQGSTASTRGSCAFNFSIPVKFPTASKDCQINFKVEYDGYLRDKISPYPSGIYWKPEIDLTRALSGIAFAWQIILGRPVKNYSWN